VFFVGILQRLATTQSMDYRSPRQTQWPSPLTLAARAPAHTRRSPLLRAPTGSPAFTAHATRGRGRTRSHAQPVAGRAGAPLSLSRHSAIAARRLVMSADSIMRVRALFLVASAAGFGSHPTMCGPGVPGCETLCTCSAELAELETLRATMAAKDSEIAAKDSEIAAKDGEIANLQAELLLAPSPTPPSPPSAVGLTLCGAMHPLSPSSDIYNYVQTYKVCDSDKAWLGTYNQLWLVQNNRASLEDVFTHFPSQDACCLSPPSPPPENPPPPPPPPEPPTPPASPPSVPPPTNPPPCPPYAPGFAPTPPPTPPPLQCTDAAYGVTSDSVVGFGCSMVTMMFGPGYACGDGGFLSMLSVSADHIPGFTEQHCAGLTDEQCSILFVHGLCRQTCCSAGCSFGSETYGYVTNCDGCDGCTPPPPPAPPAPPEPPVPPPSSPPPPASPPSVPPPTNPSPCPPYAPGFAPTPPPTPPPLQCTDAAYGVTSNSVVASDCSMIILAYGPAFACGGGGFLYMVSLSADDYVPGFTEQHCAGLTDEQCSILFVHGACRQTCCSAGCSFGSETHGYVTNCDGCDSCTPPAPPAPPAPPPSPGPPPSPPSTPVTLTVLGEGKCGALTGSSNGYSSGYSTAEGCAAACGDSCVCFSHNEATGACEVKTGTCYYNCGATSANDGWTAYSLG